MGYRSMVVAAMSAALLTLGTVSSLEAGAQTPLAASLSVDPDQAEAGWTVTVSGSCEGQYSSPVEIFLDSVNAPGFHEEFKSPVDSADMFSTEVTVPTNASPGTYEFSTDCAEAFAPFEVLAPVGPSLELDPVSGAAHDDVTATGTCPRWAEHVEIIFGDVPVASDSVDNATGTFGPVDFDVPDVPAGSYYVTTDCDGDASFEVFPVPVDPTLVLNPMSGQVGDAVSAIGTCPVDSESVEIFFGTTLVTSDSVNSSTGAFGPVTFPVPDVDPGDYDVTTSCEGHASFGVLAPVLPSLELDPVSGVGGSDVATTGSCPRYTEYVEIFFEDSLVTSASVDSSTGAIGPVGFPVPDVPPGFYGVTTDCGGEASFEVLDVEPTLALDPASGQVGDGLTATGTCPVSRDSVEIFFGNTSVGYVTLDSSSGEFGPVGFPVPDVPRGVYDVTTDCGGKATFEVIDVEPTLELDPASGQVGDGVSATGTCPVGSGSVGIFFGDISVRSAPVDSSTGEFALTFAVPGVPPGSFGVTTDCGGQASFDVIPVGAIPATLELDPAQGELGVDVTASGTCPLDHSDVTLLLDDRTVATTAGDPATGEFQIAFPMLGVEGPTHTVTTSCGASEEFTLLFPSPSTNSAGPGAGAAPGTSAAPRGRPNRPRSQLPTPTPIDTPQGPRIIVPDLTGLTEDEVIMALGDQLTLADRTGGLGVVTRQLPLPGTLVEPASEVSILLAEPELQALESETSRLPLAVLTILVGALFGALLYGERVRRRHARERRWVDTDVRTELETAEPALSDVPERSVLGLDVRLELRRDPKHLKFREVGRAHN